MEQKVLLAYGWDRLLRDILEVALAGYGWRVYHSQMLPSESDDVGFILVYCSQTRVDEALKDIRNARAEHPNAKIVVVSNETSEGCLLRFIQTGIASYVVTDQGLSELLSALQMAKTNRTISNGRTIELVLRTISKLKRCSTSNHPGLTNREIEILHLITAGLSNKEIADQLSIAPNTVKNHVHNLLDKLNVKTRHEAAWMYASPREARSRIVRNTWL